MISTVSAFTTTSAREMFFRRCSSIVDPLCQMWSCAASLAIVSPNWGTKTIFRCFLLFQRSYLPLLSVKSNSPLSEHYVLRIGSFSYLDMLSIKEQLTVQVFIFHLKVVSAEPLSAATQIAMRRPSYKVPNCKRSCAWRHENLVVVRARYSTAFQFRENLV